MSNTFAKSAMSVDAVAKLLGRKKHQTIFEKISCMFFSIAKWVSLVRKGGNLKTINLYVSPSFICYWNHQGELWKVCAKFKFPLEILL